MLTVPLFGPWRPLWDVTLAAETQRADQLAEKRNAGRWLPPSAPAELLRRVQSEAYASLFGGPQSPEKIIHALSEVWPLVRASVWPRWLFLEAALESASRSGGLHLSALVLRTLIEELDALQPLAGVDRMLRAGRYDPDVVVAGLSVLRSRAVPRTQAKSGADLLASANEAPASPREERLQRAFDALGDYVHPNYGSHVLVTRPDSAEAATILVEAFCVVYEAFLTLPWVDERDEQDAAAHSDPPSPSEELHVFERLARETERLLAQPRPGDGPLSAQTVAIFRRQVEIDQALDADAVRPEGVDEIRRARVVAALLVGRDEHDAWPTPLHTPGDRLRYAFLATAESRLVDDAARAAKERSAGQRDSESWLALLCSALTFSINMTEFKLTALGRDAARLIVEGNLVGATLSVRAMLEHHAVAMELGGKLTALWTRLTKAAPKEERIEALLGDAEKQIARVLAASPETKELATEWRQLWVDSIRRYHVLDPIKAFDQDHPGFLKTYGLLSHIVHGTVATGGDLLGPGGADVVRRQLPQLVILLANVSDAETAMDRLAPTAWIAHRLAALQRDAGSPLGSRIERSRIGDGAKLKPRRDVLGVGSEEDPFRFRPGLLYHEAYDHFLRQEGLVVRTRRLHDFTNGFGDRVETEDGRVLYFLNDTLPAS